MAHETFKAIYDPEKYFPRAKNNHIISEPNLRRYTCCVSAIHLYYIGIYIYCVCFSHTLRSVWNLKLDIYFYARKVETALLSRDDFFRLILPCTRRYIIRPWNCITLF